MNRYERVAALLDEAEGTGTLLETKVKEFVALEKKHDGDPIVRLMMLDQLADELFDLKRGGGNQTEIELLRSENARLKREIASMAQGVGGNGRRNAQTVRAAFYGAW